MPSKNQLRVVDFFCGAGGWSEGLHQQGFQVIMGIDNWAPSLKTHNLNHGLQDDPTDILIFEKCSPDFIDEKIPEAELIVGSPPCVSFSMSNNAGKADKTLGIRLIESYLRIVAVKKHNGKRTLKAWYMENVPNSKNFVKQEYRFMDLGLKEWAKKIGKSPDDIALRVGHPDNGAILCAADYGSPQKRERFVCGEILTGSRKGKYLPPEKTNENHYVTLGSIKQKLPAPNSEYSKKKCVDPNYPNLSLPLNRLTDHFYDTGVYEVEWQAARRAKVDHPFMGKMSFPEDETKPSRTIMATRSASTREAILYKSEYGRNGDGEYRLPTIREAASLMGFPITYQFYGTESVKWRQIGNAVCPHLSAAIGKALRPAFGLEELKAPLFTAATNPEGLTDLNEFKERILDKPPGKKVDSKFRRHPFKTGNMTIALINFNPHDKEDRPGIKWHACAYIGSGKAYRPVLIEKKDWLTVKAVLEKDPEGRDIVAKFNKTFSGRIANHAKLQKMHVEHKDDAPFLKPDSMVDAIKEFISKHVTEKDVAEHPEMEKIIGKKKIPKRQLMAIFALGSVAALA